MADVSVKDVNITVTPVPTTTISVVNSSQSVESTENSTVKSNVSVANPTQVVTMSGGIPGAKGEPGDTGPAGVGVPTGGTTGQVLSKTSATDYDTEWVDQSGGSGAVDSVNSQTGAVVLDADDIDDTSTTNKFVTAADVTKLGNLSGTNTGDQDLSGYALATDIPTDNASLTNGAGYITSYTETDPVYSASEAANITATDITNLGNLSGTNTGDQDLSGYALTSSLGTAATTDATAYATAAQGALADSATQPGDLSTVATTGAYSDLSGTPTVPSSIDDLYDVDTSTTAPTDTQVLAWNDTDSKWEPADATSGGSGGANLAATLSATQTVITSDTGTDATIPAVDGTNAGVMTPTMKGKLDGIASGAEVNTVDSVNTQTGAVVLDADDISDTSTTNKFVTATDITNLGNLSGTNTGDQDLSDLTTGPSSSTDNAIARFDSTTGKLLQNSLTTLDDTGSISLPNEQQVVLGDAGYVYSNSAGTALGLHANDEGNFDSLNDFSIQSTLGDINLLSNAAINLNGSTNLVNSVPIATTTDTQTLTNKDLSSGTNTFPTFNQNTTGTASNVTGTVAVAHGGTGATSLTGILKGNGTSAVTAVTAPSGAIVGTTDSQTLTNKDLSSSTNTMPTNLPTFIGYQSGATNSTPSSVKIQTGWSYFQGNSTNIVSKAITFPTAFSSVLNVFCTMLSAKTSAGAPTSLADFTVTLNPETPIAYPKSISTTGFSATMTEAASNPSSVYYGFQWVAYGT